MGVDAGVGVGAVAGVDVGETDLLAMPGFDPFTTIDESDTDDIPPMPASLIQPLADRDAPAARERLERVGTGQREFRRDPRPHVGPGLNRPQPGELGRDTFVGGLIRLSRLVGMVVEGGVTRRHGKPQATGLGVWSARPGSVRPPC